MNLRKYIIAATAFIGLGLGGAVVAQTIATSQNGYLVEGDLIRPGNVIQKITMSNRGQDENTCRKACDANNDCSAYTYVQRASNRKPECHLRLIALPRGARRTHGFTKVVSGTKLGFFKDVGGMSPYVGRTMTGGQDIRTFAVPNQDPVACSDACYRDGNCKSFTYAPPSRFPRPKAAQCTLYSNIGQLSPTTKAGFFSGAKGNASKSGSGTSSPRPTGKPGFRPTVKPQIQRPDLQAANPRPQIVLPDDTEGTLSDDADAPTPGEEQFPGEMLTPDDE